MTESFLLFKYAIIPIQFIHSFIICAICKNLLAIVVGNHHWHLSPQKKKKEMLPILSNYVRH